MQQQTTHRSAVETLEAKILRLEKVSTSRPPPLHRCCPCVCLCVYVCVSLCVCGLLTSAVAHRQSQHSLVSLIVLLALCATRHTSHLTELKRAPLTAFKILPLASRSPPFGAPLSAAPPSLATLVA